MADNYIERRMDDLRQGRLAVSRPRPVARIPARHESPLAGKRVVVIDGARGIGGHVTKAFVDAGCRVAVFDSDSEEGARLAYSMGIRYSPVDSCDLEATERAILGLLKAWRDVDIAVDAAVGMRGGCASVIAALWERHKRRFPIPSDYGGRLVVISQEPFIGGETLGEFGISVNSIIVPDIAVSCVDHDVCALAARISLFLSRKENQFVDGSIMKLKNNC